MNLMREKIASFELCYIDFIFKRPTREPIYLFHNFTCVILYIVAYILSIVAITIEQRWLCFLVNRKDEIVNYTYTKC